MSLRKLLTSWFNPKYLSLLLCLLLANCGFQPLHVDNHAQSDHRFIHDLGLIEIGHLPEREGQILRNAILDQIQSYQGKHFPFFLEMNLTINEKELGTRKDKSTTRRFVRITLEYKLRRRDDGYVISESKIRKEGQYQQDLSGFVTHIGKEKVTENLLLQIRNQLIRNLIIALRKEK